MFYAVVLREYVLPGISACMDAYIACCYSQGPNGSFEKALSAPQESEGNSQLATSMVFAMGTASDAAVERLNTSAAVREQWPSIWAGPLLLQGSQSLPRDWVLSAINFTG